MAISNAQKGRTARQAILDFLNQNGPAPTRVIAAAMVPKTTSLQARGRLSQMLDHKEIGYDEVMEEKILARHYKALVAQTAHSYGPLTPEQKAAVKRPLLRGGDKDSHTIVGGPGSKVYLCDDSRPPHPRQGGQGSVRGPYSATSLELAP